MPRSKKQGGDVPIHEKGYGIVLHRFWGDTLRDGWSDDERLLGLYLLTNEHRNLEGFYNLRFDYAAFDLRWDRERFAATMASLATKGFVAFDSENEAVLILKTLKTASPDTHLQGKGLAKRAASVRCSFELRQKFAECLSVYAPAIYERHGNAIAKPLPSHLSLSPVFGIPSSEDPVLDLKAGAPTDDLAHAYPPGFERAWAAFPHHDCRSSKVKAAEVWVARKLEPMTDGVLAWIAAHAASNDWQKDGGEFVPGMQVWLKRHDFSEPPPRPRQASLPMLSEKGRRTAAAMQRILERERGKENTFDG